VAALPTGVVSFVLTDVEGSTKLWERAPNAMAAALARHDQLVTEAVVAEAGALLKPRGEGDSTFSVFTRASNAVRAAHRLQAAIRAEAWPPEAVIRTRIAVHTGEAVERDGDYLGPAVNRVARLRGVANAGEIIVSAATAAIVRAALPTGSELVDIGAVELRGLDHPEPAYVLAAPDLDPVERTRAASRDGGSAAADGAVSHREDGLIRVAIADDQALVVIRVVIVDDQPVVRAGVARILGPGDGFQVVAECGDGDEVVAAVALHQPDVVLMDIRMRRVDGITAIRALSAAGNPPPVLVLTTFDDDAVLWDSLDAGAAGFVLKDASAEDLIAAARAVANGAAWLDPKVAPRVLKAFRSNARPRIAAAARIDALTDREHDVLRYMARGATNSEIAVALFVSEATVKSHVGSIFSKLAVRDRAAAIVFAYDQGIVDPRAG
jgi:DNA-binding NarL/FixJ family response regulator/class 3 adenylate cyclase